MVISQQLLPWCMQNRVAQYFNSLPYKNASRSRAKAIMQNLILHQEGLQKCFIRSHIVKGNCTSQQAAQLKWHLAKLLCASQPLNEGSYQGSAVVGCALFGIQATWQSLPAHKLQAVPYFQRQRRQPEVSTHTQGCPAQAYVMTLVWHSGEGKHISYLVTAWPWKAGCSCWPHIICIKRAMLKIKISQLRKISKLFHMLWQRSLPKTHMVHVQQGTLRFCRDTGFVPATFKSMRIHTAYPITTATLCAPTPQAKYLGFILHESFKV